MIRNNKRNPYRIVNRSHQYRFLAYILVYNTIVAFVLVFALFVPDFIRMNDQSLGIEIRAIAADNILNLHYRLWPVFISLAVFIALHSTRMFNRFVGPLYRFTKVFKDVSNGNLDNMILLRKNDFLLPEADIINNMFDAINLKVKDIQTKGQDALNQLSKLEQEKIETDKENIAILRQNLDELIASASYFKTR
jgi:hypothetical protein